jgi:hypothetical protein
VGVVENAIFVVNLVNGRATMGGVVFAEDVAEVPKQQRRYGVGHLSLRGVNLVAATRPSGAPQRYVADADSRLRAVTLRSLTRDPSLLASQEGVDCRLAGGQGLGFRSVVPAPNSDGQWLATMKDLPNPLIGPFATAHRDQMKFVLYRTRHFLGDAMFDGPTIDRASWLAKAFRRQPGRAAS